MKLLNALGYAGLLPFIGLPLLYQQQIWFDSPTLLHVYQLYSALILGFMAGVLWPALPQSDSHNNSHSLALLAVTFPVLSVIGLVLIEHSFLLLQLVLFLLLRLTELLTSINQRYSRSYRSLRNWLTLVVSVSHLVLYWLIYKPI
jgi:hypothetical protein